MIHARRDGRGSGVGEPVWGIGSASGHHGELLQGVFFRRGSLVRGLVTLPWPAVRATAAFVPNDSGAISVVPASNVKARRAAEETVLLAETEQPVGGLLELHSEIPRSWGLGSSTCDVLAAIRATSAALSLSIDPDTAALIAVRAEAAADPVMFDFPVLFAHRDGYVIDVLTDRFPPLVVFGVRPDPEPRGVDTTAMSPPGYTRRDAIVYEGLVEMLRASFLSKDPELLGWVATESAVLNQRFLPLPEFDRLRRLVGEVGALGLQASHSGVIAGFLFRPDDPQLAEKLALLRGELRVMKTWTGSTTSPRVDLDALDESAVRDGAPVWG